MAILHPIFFVPFFIIIYLLFKGDQISLKDSKNILKVMCLFLIIGAGGRYNVGADYPVYKAMYETGFPLYTTYADVWHKATFQPNAMEIEWLYVLLNKIFFDLGLPYYFLTFFMATCAVTILYRVLSKYSHYPGVSFLYYFLPLYFITECGQMRQGMGAAMIVFSLQFVMQRNLWKFLLTIFFALGFHKTAIIFIPAYWLVLLPFTINRWLVLLTVSVLLAPFEVYKLFGGAIETFMPQDVANAYTGYSNDNYYGNELKTGFADAINLFFIVLLIIYDKIGQKKVHYYEYFRNLTFFGFCLFYILRGNEIFATRLPGSYFTVVGLFIVPGFVTMISVNKKPLLKFTLLLYFLGFYVLFAMGNGKRGNFAWDKYKNVLWSEVK